GVICRGQKTKRSNPAEEQAGRMQKGRLQLHTARLTQTELALAMATKAEHTMRRATEIQGLVAAHPAESGPDLEWAALRVPVWVVYLATCPPLPSAFQDIFKLFSSSPTGTVDMHSMKGALGNVGIQLSPQETFEALLQVDLDGVGIVSFSDFLGVFNDNHRLAQCIGEGQGCQVCDPQGLQTLFLEILFKLLGRGFVPSKLAQEVMSYYFKKQWALGLSPGCGGWGALHAGLTFCHAARISGLSNSELARSLHRLHEVGARNPYSQIPNLEESALPERGTRSPAPDRPKFPPNPGPAHSPLRWPPPASRRDPGPATRASVPSNRAPSPPTLVKQQPFSQAPAGLQRPAMKSLYK
uniref:EF-hand domain-containing protein n=1 Tax=Theropithecus gelada TaxID=9565 RepID=A0A8D2FE86_THEGE